MRFVPFLFIFPLYTACSPPPQAVEIPFDVHYEGQAVRCNGADRPVSLTDLRFFVHDVRLIAEDGSTIPLDLVPDGTWQNDAVVLLDFENGEGACINGSPETNTVLRGTWPGEEVAALEFEIGVPATLNHADPLFAEPPLNYTVMHWHWRSGYKFLRAGIETGDDGFWMHLGSTRCEGTIGDIRGCKSANRPLVRIDSYSPGDPVVIDLADLFDGIDLEDAEPAECMSAPDDDDCKRPFAALGIDFDSGDRLSPAKVFGLGE